MPPSAEKPTRVARLASMDSRPEPEPPEPKQPDNIHDWFVKKRKTDDIGDDRLWRIHDDLYDLTDFIDKVLQIH